MIKLKTSSSTRGHTGSCFAGKGKPLFGARPHPGVGAGFNICKPQFISKGLYGNKLRANIKKGLYEHFKGGRYEVLGVAKHSETLEDFVVYRALYGKEELWIRPAKMFLEKVELNGKKIPRFKFVKNVWKK